MRKGLGFHNRHSPGGAPPPPVPANDPNFPNVVLLLPGSGTNGAQNNTFLDASTNAFAITRNGNTTQGTFSPYGPNWSNFFDGTGDYLIAPGGTAFDFGSGSFTIELFINTGGITQTANAGLIVRSASGNSRYAFAFAGDGRTLEAWVDAIGRVAASATVVSDGLWHHVALVRDGTSFKIYVDGVAGATSTTSSTSIDNSTNALNIGFDPNNSKVVNGYISNLRIVKGTAVYTANFTPPTAPLSPISGTSLLTCQSNRIIDNSTNAFAITRNGDVRVERFSPFAPGAAYDPAVIGGSGYFDGSGDYLTTPSNTALVMGTGQFWFEAWIYMPSAPSPQYVVLGTNDGPTPNSALTVRIQPSALRVDRHGFVAYDSSTVTWQYNAWQHIAVGRDSGNTLRFFVNGQAVGTRASTTDNFAGNSSAIGYNPSDNEPATVFKGYIASARLLKGECLYTAAFTPPTAPLTAIANTSLLLLTTNAGVIDNAMMNDAETVGNAQISNAQAKWGSTSISFDGTGDWLVMPNAPPQQLGTGNFTIEGWLRLNATGVAYGVISKGTATTGWSVNVTSGNKLQFSYTATQLTGATSLSSGQWYHFAVVRNGTGTGNLRIYLDGVVDATSAGAVTDNFNQTSVQYVGANRTGGDALNGYVQDARITNGVARYTANFTPPTAAFPLF